MWFTAVGNSCWQPECRRDRKEHSDKAEHTNERHGMESRVDGNETEPFQGPKKVQGCQEV